LTVLAQVTKAASGERLLMASCRLRARVHEGPVSAFADARGELLDRSFMAASRKSTYRSSTRWTSRARPLGVNLACLWLHPSCWS